MMLDEGLNKTRDLMKSEFTEVSIGTGTTEEAVTDTSLEIPDDNTTRTIDWVATDKQIDYEADPIGTTGDGNTYAEMIIGNVDGIIAQRIVFPGLLKASTSGIRIDGGFFIESI